MSTNTLQYTEVSNAITRIETLTDSVKTTLDNINNLITDTVNTGQGVWDGQSANSFLSKWNDFAYDIPSFVAAFRKQANNVQTILDKTQAVDVTTSIPTAK